MSWGLLTNFDFGWNIPLLLEYLDFLEMGDPTLVLNVLNADVRVPLTTNRQNYAMKSA